jgi:hypothetical protein
MRYWTCLAWSVGLTLSLGVQAAEPMVPPSPQVFGESNQLPLIEFLAPPIPGESAPPSPIDQLGPGNGASLPPMIASQSGTYASPSSRMSAAAPAAAKPAGLPKPPPQPWKPCFFDNDFSYKKAPHTHLFGEELKDMPLDGVLPWDLGEDARLSVGGELRYRYMNEVNRLRAPFENNGGRSTYDLIRWRQYFDLKHSDWVRVYVEGIDASINHANLPITGIDVNRWDLENAFVDLKILERDDKPVWLRVGRQEMNFGSQRLISALDWANTRRNFEGLRINSPGTTWDLDAWLVHPLNTATAGTGQGLGVFRNDHAFDQAEESITFGGGWATYKGVKDHTIDSFFLWSQYDKAFPGGFGFPPLSQPYSFPIGDIYTVGTRWQGTFNVDGGERAFLTDVEGGYQFGNNKGQNVQAGYFVAGGGHTWKTVKWEPTVWMFYDWASGDSNPTDGKNGTFFQYYGLVHAYLGLIDNVARQNISDINYRVQLKPTSKLQLQAAQHFFQLANSHDSLYTVSGQKFGTPGGHGSDIGQELDLLATYTVNQNFSIEAGQFWFWYGSYVNDVQPLRQDAQQFYVQTTFRY